ncbi:hypothetical protein J5U46_08530 [Micromonospora tulbaghiae]|uniref:Uncharacterized protein n=1 Tax=Micromonospora tulbaghiae TaxID=479978 RepID=A0AAW4JMJ9_9ACTN|nr:hypothetical protein [Micromonospora tulbaghiae]MBO4140186.1 hypothetical protein [Micromonospora tulbaghiae]
MDYKNEDEIKKVLGIDTWRNLSKDKVFQFAAMMPEMDTEVALKIIEQLPEYRKLLTKGLELLGKEHESTLKSNSQSQESVHQGWREIREAIKSKLEQEGLDWEQTKFLVEQMMETGRQESAKDTENKQFLDGLFTKAAIGTGAAAVLAIAFVGGKVLLQNGDIRKAL